jgi:asparagine synthase (glutamine-hydrolysing)
LRPGECATWTLASGLSRSTYYQLRDHIQPRDIGVEQARAETRDLLIDTARLHMRSDVPVAVALSGGLDSSALLACLDLSGDIAGVHCFSVEFENELSERRWIEAAAAHHGLISHIEVCGRQEIADKFATLIRISEGPLGGVMNNALLRVMSAAANQGFKVIQDGTGLDEAFAGYRNHHNLYLGQKIREKSPGWRQALSEYARNWDVTEAGAEAAALAELDSNGTAIDGTVPVRPDLLKADFVGRHGSQVSWPDAAGDRLRNSLIDYLQVRKIPRNTRMKDRLSMAFGLELRLPFLDHRLVEHALSLPEEMYFLGGRSKSIVREALAGDMDEDVRIATKRSIQAPQGKWLIAEPLADYVRDLIASQSFTDRGFFEPKAVHDAFDEFCLGNTPNSFFVWQWINMENWFRTFIDGASTVATPGAALEASAVS